MPTSDNTNPSSASDPAGPSRARRRELAAADALRGLIRDLLTEKYPQLAERGEELPLTLSLRLQGGVEGELRFEPELREQVLRQAEDHLAPLDAYADGAVWDFQAGSRDLPNCRPPDPLSVFAGYDPFGRPRWCPLTELLPEAGSALRARVISGRELKREQLSSAGRGAHIYSLLGQVCLGYLEVPAAWWKRAGTRLALSLQAVETRDLRGHFALRLNVLAGGLLADEREMLLQEPALRGVADALRHARAALAGVESRAAAAWHHQDTDTFRHELREVPRVLARLADAAAPAEKPQTAEPAPSAADLQRAELRQLFFDTARDSWVLLGGEGRAHVFNTEGLHLTSFAADAARVAERLGRGRWRPASPAETDVLDRIRRSGGGEG